MHSICPPVPLQRPCRQDAGLQPASFCCHSGPLEKPGGRGNKTLEVKSDFGSDFALLPWSVVQVDKLGQGASQTCTSASFCTWTSPCSACEHHGNWTRAAHTCLPLKLYLLSSSCIKEGQPFMFWMLNCNHYYDGQSLRCFQISS